VDLSDTHPLIEQRVIDGLRKMTPAQKLARVQALNNAVLQMAAARIRKQYGDVDNNEMRLRLAALWLDRKTMVRLFGWDPEKNGY
jgi:hypothetical protein